MKRQVARAAINQRLENVSLQPESESVGENSTMIESVEVASVAGNYPKGDLPLW